MVLRIASPGLIQELLEKMGIPSAQDVFGLDTIVVPVVSVEPSSLTGAKLASGTTPLAAVGAQYSNVQLLNPTGSGVRVLLTSVYCSLGAAGVFHLQRHNTAITNNVTTRGWLDSRIAGNPVAQIRTQNNATSFGAAARRASFEVAGTEAYPVRDLDLSLMPGDGLVVVPDVVNLAERVSFFWEEIRIVAPGTG